MKNSSNSVLITGVAGLIGSRLASWILDNQSEFQVIGVDDLSGGYKDHVDDRVVFYQMDCASDEMEQIFSDHQPTYVFHLAAYAAEGLSPFIRKYNYQNNLISTANIINESIKSGVKRLVFTSSMAVYGVGNPPFEETDQPAPIDPYGVAKYACEMDIKIAGEQHGLDWCILRPHNVYGVNQNIWDVYRNVLGIWMYQFKNDMPLTIFGDGSQQRDFSSINDLLLPFWNAASTEKASKQIINVGSGISYTILEAANTLIEVMGGGEIQFLEQRHEVKNAHPTWEKSVEYLGFEDKTDLKTGLEEMWAWAKDQPERERFVWSKYEIEKGMYGSWKTKS